MHSLKLVLHQHSTCRATAQSCGQVQDGVVFNTCALPDTAPERMEASRRVPALLLPTDATDASPLAGGVRLEWGALAERGAPELGCDANGSPETCTRQHTCAQC